MKVDYIIVGQGIAGSFLAYRFFQKHKKFVVIDNYHQGSASRVAAGIMNPLGLKRLVKSWKADLFVPFSFGFYKELELFFNDTFFFPRPIYRIFPTANEWNLWRQKAEDSDLGKYLSLSRNAYQSDFIKLTQFQGADVLMAAHADVKKLLNLFRNWLRKKNGIMEEKFEYEALKMVDNHVVYKGIQADKVIFCEGHQAIHNPYFKELGLNLVKGEILTIYVPGFDSKKIIKKGIFMVPLGKHLYHVGATYNWQDLTLAPTEDAKKALIKGIREILKCNFTVVGHQAGIRPAIKDRRPVLGMHPGYNQLALFNGLGTRGLTLAPYFSTQMYNLLEEGLNVDDEVALSRFLKKSAIQKMPM